MKRLVPFAVAFVLISAVAFGHGANDHVRGVVTDVSATSVTVETATAPAATHDTQAHPKTTYRIQGKTARAADLKVGQRVVIDVPQKTSDALVIQIGVAAQTTTPNRLRRSRPPRPSP